MQGAIADSSQSILIVFINEFLCELSVFAVDLYFYVWTLHTNGTETVECISRPE